MRATLTSVNDRIETNLVFFDVSGTGLSARDISARLREEGIWIGAINEQRMRAVTHLDVAREDVIEASDAQLSEHLQVAPELARQRLDLQAMVERRDQPGSPASARVASALDAAQERLEAGP